jgi:molybdate transport system substrate-binding protein
MLGYPGTPLHVNISEAAEVSVLSAVAMKSALDDLASKFEATTGTKLLVTYGTAGELAKRIRGGETADLTILPKPWMDQLVQQGKVSSDNIRTFASASVGVAVRAGAPKPDIGSADALKRSLLAAKSISYADPAQGGASGIHFAHVLERLGIAEEMKPKAKLVTGPPDLVAQGEAEIAVAMVPEILPVAGVDYVGPLPQELQNRTDFVYVAGAFAESKQPGSSRALIEFICSPAAAPVLKAKGLEPG